MYTCDLAGLRVAVALSGGVDSAVTAALLKDQGADVIAMTLLLQEHDDGREAEAIAQAIGIPFHVVDARQRFKLCVMDDFAESYFRGETPNPCANCNKKIKFGDLFEAAKAQGAEALATGHYVRRMNGPEGPELHQGVDPQRDQSYFLFGLSNEQLSFLRFPLGDRSKQDVRQIARDFGLNVAAKKDSQDICFVPQGDYVSLLKKMRPEANKAGKIVDRDGHVLGTHSGIVHYTIGQRKGLGLNDRIGENNAPLYVIQIDHETAEVVVGPREALACNEVCLREVNWLARPVSENGQVVTTRLRSTMVPVPARFFMEAATGEGRLVLDMPIYGLSSGQAGVIYHETRLLGGGWIV